MQLSDQELGIERSKDPIERSKDQSVIYPQANFMTAPK